MTKTERAKLIYEYQNFKSLYLKAMQKDDIGMANSFMEDMSRIAEALDSLDEQLEFSFMEPRNDY